MMRLSWQAGEVGRTGHEAAENAVVDAVLTASRTLVAVLSPHGTQVQGWITNASVLRAVADQIGNSPHQARPRMAAPDEP